MIKTHCMEFSKNYQKHCFKARVWARKMSQWLRALAILPEDRDLISSTNNYLELQFQGIEHSRMASVGTKYYAVHRHAHRENTRRC